MYEPDRVFRTSKRTTVSAELWSLSGHHTCLFEPVKQQMKVDQPAVGLPADKGAVHRLVIHRRAPAQPSLQIYSSRRRRRPERYGSSQAAKQNVFPGIGIVEVAQCLLINHSMHTRVSKIEDRPAFLRLYPRRRSCFGATFTTSR